MEAYEATKAAVIEGMVAMLKLADELELPPLQVQADFMAAFGQAAQAAGE
jgi:hypothetical protein